MSIAYPPGQFKAPSLPSSKPPKSYRHVVAHHCLGEVRPQGDMYSAVAVFSDGLCVWLGIYPDRAEACEAVIEAHGGSR